MLQLFSIGESFYKSLECMLICIRVNISNALTMSLPTDLKLVGVQRNIALTIFFVPYIIFEIPSNLLMKKFSPHVWRRYSQQIFAYKLTGIVSGCIMAFGIIMLAQGFGSSDYVDENSLIDCWYSDDIRWTSRHSILSRFS
jgi:hypothetical protein